ncbi:hypothetical protein C0991_009382 [Blastosporella zonata]|nr:hypothetical protein C0991_009382 [Blastosporella zonata]
MYNLKRIKLHILQAYFARIEEVNLNGPALRAVLETNPFALAKAAELDAERKKKGLRSTLHGIPVLLKVSQGIRENIVGLITAIKDNIATLPSEGMNTTAGSLALKHSIVPDDAEVVKRLRAAGAIILGKVNLSEFAHYRGTIASGWSGVGGQTTSAYYPGADPSGSSSGSGVAASIGLSTVTLGTETDGSIISPSSHNNIVGIKPTVGLTSRSGGSSFAICIVSPLTELMPLVVPLSSHQDTVGPMTRCVADAAVVLTVIAGKDVNDSDTLSQPDLVPDFTKALNERALEGKRIGVPRRGFLDGKNDSDAEIRVAFEQALEVIRSLGATIVDPTDLPSVDEFKSPDNEIIVLDTDFKIGLNDYLSKLTSNPSGVRSMADLIKFNDDNPELEKPEGFEDQSILIRAEATTGRDAAFFAALAANRDQGATRGIDSALQTHNLDALVIPTNGLTSTPAAMAGYPVVSGLFVLHCSTGSGVQINCAFPVPLGFYSENIAVGSAGPLTVHPAPGIPFGLSFLGTAYSDFDLIGFAYAYEQKTQTRLSRKAYEAAIPKTQLRDVLDTA